MITYSRSQLTFQALSLGDQNNETIVLLHGFPADAESWLPVAGQLAQNGYRVLIPDQRGYSPEARPESIRAYKLEELADDIASLVTASGAERVHLVGHDWGGAVAWAFASKYPQLLSSLVVVSAAHPQAFIASLWQSRQILLSWYMFFFQLPYLPELILTSRHGAALAKMLTRSGLNQDEASRYVKKMEDKGLLTSALNWYRAIPFSWVDTQHTKLVQVRTLLICGGKDSFISHKSALLTKKWVSGPYELSYLPDETHWIPEESPEMLAQIIHMFVSQSSYIYNPRK